jgi:hypothetical protein
VGARSLSQDERPVWREQCHNDHSFATCRVVHCFCEYLRSQCEEVLVKSNENASERLYLGQIARNFRVRCPVHGSRIIQEFGNHLTAQPRPRVRSEWRRKNPRPR